MKLAMLNGKTFFKTQALVTTVAYLVLLPMAQGEETAERLVINAQINGKPVRFAFDTASEAIVLFGSTATRLGLQVTNPPNQELSPGRIPAGFTEPCDLTLGETTQKTSLRVHDLPTGLRPNIEGFLGWGQIKENIFRINATGRTVESLERVPIMSSEWLKLPLRRDSKLLIVQIAGERGTKRGVLVDTGSPHGVSLAPEKWREWKAAHPNQPVTLVAFYAPGAGLVVREEAWAKKLSFGPLIVNDVPVAEAISTEIALASPNYEATIGLTALKRFDFIADGKHNVAYLRPNKTLPPPYQHNRMGAVFVPNDLQSDDLIAHVVNGSPAYEAGIRNGDILLKIGDLDVTKWRTDPAVMPLSRFGMRPAGSKLDMSLRRGDKEYRTTIVLRDIIGPR